MRSDWDTSFTCIKGLTRLLSHCFVNVIFVRKTPFSNEIKLVAAANIEEPGTIVSASTLHNTFGFDGEYETKLDFSKTTDQKVAELIALQLLLIDEVSMLDIDIYARVFSRSVALIEFIVNYSVFFLLCEYLRW